MKSTLFFVALMEIVKLQVIAASFFLMLAKPLPFLPASAAFLAALAVSRALRALGGRIGFHLLSHIVGLAIAFLALFAVFLGIPFGLAGVLPRNGNEAVTFAFVFFWTAAFWLRGAWLGRQTPSNAFCVSRFDEGLGLFLFALSLSALVHIENPLSGKLIVPFLLFGILALGISRSENAERGGLSRRSRRLMVIPVATAFILVSIGIVVLVPSFFAPAKEVGNSVQYAFSVLEPYLGAFLRWLFGFQRRSPAADSSSASGGGLEAPPIADESGWLGTLIATVLMWSLVVLISAVLIGLIAFGLVKLFRYLAGRVEKEGDGLNLSFLPARLRAFILGCARFFARLAAKMTRSREKRSGAIEAYAKLLSCGRAAGAARRLNETPREFAERLAGLFPRSAPNALFVAEVLEKEAYGGHAAAPDDERELRKIRQETRPAAFLAERARNAFSRRRPEKE